MARAEELLKIHVDYDEEGSVARKRLHLNILDFKILFAAKAIILCVGGRAKIKGRTKLDFPLQFCSPWNAETVLPVGQN